MKGDGMNRTTRKTRVCTLDTLDEELKATIRAHGAKYGLDDIESDILMCCETISIHLRKGFLGGIKTTLSAVYVTPKWLVWADSSGRNDVVAGKAHLKQIDVGDDRSTTQYATTPDQGLNIQLAIPIKTRQVLPFCGPISQVKGDTGRTHIRVHDWVRFMSLQP